MALLPAECVPDLVDFVRIADAAQDIGSLRSHTLDLIRRVFRSDSTILWLVDEARRIVEPLGVNVPRRFFPMYRDYYCRLNPFEPVNMGSFTATSVALEQIVSLHDFRKSEYYNDFIKPQKIRRQMVVYVRLNNRLTSVICTHRSNDRRFSQEDLSAGDIVASHLSAAFQRVHLMEEVKRKGSFFQMILDCTDEGIAVLDLGKRPLFINKRAMAICARIGREGIPANRASGVEPVIPPPVLSDCESLEQCLHGNREVGFASPPTRERILPVSSLEKCLFRCRIVTEDTTDFTDPLFLVTMELVPVYPGFKDLSLKREYHLTKREVEIVSYVCRGRRNAEIADELFISEGTVKNHLRNIFEKAKVKNRTGLIHRVLSL